ncbi:MAG: ATP-binding protein [Deltaproteobacteria bacterium]|nr:ATP-binding protein [Deltaproteobacteria bacterium]
MTNYKINASPTKELFIRTLIKDISIIDAVLDLVDNSIDGYLRHGYTDRKKIMIKISGKRFEVWDNCGGIDLESARNVVFRFGVHKATNKHRLGVYGIGLKRAVFKMGSRMLFESDDSKNYFRINVDFQEWQKTDDWTLEFEEIAGSKGSAFTKICVTGLYDEVSGEFLTNRFKNELMDRIAKTYFLFMKETVDIYLDDSKIEPFELEIGFSEDVEPANKSFKIDDVKVKLTSGAHPDYHNPGWYIFCNKRLIVLGDHTSLSGWGSRGVPNYHPKFNRFKGFAYFDSDDPTKLPWKTAKNGIDVSSPVYIKALDEMQTMTQQYTSFMSKAYPTEREETIGKDILGDLATKSVFDIERDQAFKAPEIPTAPKMTTISYRKPKKEVEALKRCMGKRYMSNRELGERTFDYYKEMECPDEE